MLIQDSTHPVLLDLECNAEVTTNYRQHKLSQRSEVIVSTPSFASSIYEVLWLPQKTIHSSPAPFLTVTTLAHLAFHSSENFETGK